jgi:hypothetical protein
LTFHIFQFYCNARVNWVDVVLLPYDPLIVTVYECGVVLAAAFWLGGVIVPPPQDVNKPIDITRKDSITSFHNFLRVNRFSEIINPPTPKVGKKNAYNIPVPVPWLKAADADVVLIVRVEVALLLPAGIDAGENEHVTPVGRFVQDSESVSCNDPLTTTCAVPECPH